MGLNKLLSIYYYKTLERRHFVLAFRPDEGYFAKEALR